MDKKNIKILIADDEPDIRHALKALLASEGYGVVVAKDGREAVECFMKESPELVILDVSMPYLTGFQVLEKIRKYFGERYIPVIFLTASVTIDNKLKALHGGAVDYLTKPVALEELLARIKNHLDLKSRHDDLTRAAVYDWMTGALNKEHFIKRATDELEMAVRNKTPLSFIFMDIDNFKEINDSIGHMAGDEVISEFGRRLKKVVRKIDLLGRFGGDEFMIMLPHKGSKDARVVSERISRLIHSRPVIFDKNKIRITVSQGTVSLNTDKAISIDHLIKLTDEALYEAKDKGGDCYILREIV